MTPSAGEHAIKAADPLRRGRHSAVAIMLTLVLYGLLAVLLAGVLFLAAAYLLPAGEQIAPPVRDEPVWDLPAEHRLGYAEVATVRLPIALRGYRFAETDLLLDRLADELYERDEEIARLQSRERAAQAAPTFAVGSATFGSSIPLPDAAAPEPRYSEPRYAEPRQPEIYQPEIYQPEPRPAEAPRVPRHRHAAPDE